MNQPLIRPARLAGFLILILGGLALVWSIPTTPLPLGATASDWFRQVSPAQGLLAALRLVVLAGLIYLLTATALMLMSATLRSNALDRPVAAFTGPALQRFLRTSVGLGIGTVTSLQSLAAGAAPSPVEESPDPIPVSSAAPSADETTTLTRMDDPAPSALATAAPAETKPADTIDWWTVAPGDHLWHIAEETLIDQGEAAPSLDEIAEYWHTVCEVNHSRLVDPDNPDLIVPGQQIVLPAVTG